MSASDSRVITVPEAHVVIHSLSGAPTLGPTAEWLAGLEETARELRVRRIGPTSYLLWRPCAAPAKR
jgi:hypothetical protein